MIHTTLLHQALQHLYVPFLVAGLIVGRFGDEGAIGKARVVEQPAERFDADIALADMFVAVEL